MLDRGQRHVHVCTLPPQNFGRTDGQTAGKKMRLVSGCIRNPRDASDSVGPIEEETRFIYATCSQIFAYQKFLLETCVACRGRGY